jgi:hypothetical protein
MYGCQCLLDACSNLVEFAAKSLHVKDLHRQNPSVRLSKFRIKGKVRVAVMLRNIPKSAAALLVLGLLPGLNGCAVIAIADAAVVVATTAVKATADVAGAAVHATAAGVKAMTKDDEAKKEVSK